LHYSLRKVWKGRSAFPQDESILKVLYMGLQHVATKWTQPVPEWKAALNQLVILFGERVQV
jgi:transposase-like protein